MARLSSVSDQYDAQRQILHSEVALTRERIDMLNNQQFGGLEENNRTNDAACAVSQQLR